MTLGLYTGMSYNILEFIELESNIYYHVFDIDMNGKLQRYKIPKTQIELI